MIFSSDWRPFFYCLLKLTHLDQKSSIYSLGAAHVQSGSKCSPVNLWMTGSSPDIKELNALELEEASMFQEMERNSCVPSSIYPGFSHCMPTQACGSWQLCSTFLDLASSACVLYIPSSAPHDISQQEGHRVGDGKRGQKARASILCLHWIAFPLWLWLPEVPASLSQWHLYHLLMFTLVLAPTTCPCFYEIPTLPGEFYPHNLMTPRSHSPL